MPSSPIPYFIRQDSLNISLLSLPMRAALGVAAAVVAFALNPVQAQEATPRSGAEAAAQVALIEPATPSQTDVIRLKLHNVEDLRIPRDEQAVPNNAIPSSDADELKKQAQTEYLSAKLKKQADVVRKYVDLAWAEASKREHLNPELLIAIIKRESAFRPQVQSSYGAQGLMQVVRRWHRDKLRPSESLFDPEVNIRVGADVLEEYLELANGDLNTALRKYSGNARGYVNSILKDSRELARIGELAAAQAKLASRDIITQG